MKEQTAKKVKPDIRAITKLVPHEGNLVQGQSDLPIDPELAKQAYNVIAASENHYGASDGMPVLRKAVAEKIKKYNGIEVDVAAKTPELLITPGRNGRTRRHCARVICKENPRSFSSRIIRITA